MTSNHMRAHGDQSSYDTSNDTVTNGNEVDDDSPLTKIWLGFLLGAN